MQRHCNAEKRFCAIDEGLVWSWANKTVGRKAEIRRRVTIRTIFIYGIPFESVLMLAALLFKSLRTSVNSLFSWASF
jgi:hypothetical protein